MIDYLAGNEQTQASTVQNPDEIALDDDEEDDEEEDGENNEEENDDVNTEKDTEDNEEDSSEEEEDETEVVKQCVPDEVFGKLAEKAYQEEEPPME